MDAQRAEQLAYQLMRTHGLFEAGWCFQWSRGKRQLGAAEVRGRRNRRTGETTERKVIKLSRYLVALNDEKEVRETILHEVAHALAGVENGHNARWRAACRKVGARPERLADERVNVVEPRYAIYCGCCRRTLGKRHRRIAPPQLKRMYCKHCGDASLGKLRVRDAVGA